MRRTTEKDTQQAKGGGAKLSEDKGTRVVTLVIPLYPGPPTPPNHNQTEGTKGRYKWEHKDARCKDRNTVTSTVSRKIIRETTTTVKRNTQETKDKNTETPDVLTDNNTEKNNCIKRRKQNNNNFRSRTPKNMPEKHKKKTKK